MTPEMHARLQVLKQKDREGTATLADYKEAVVLMRGDRARSHVASETSRRSKVKAAIPSADDMLNELGS